jgi:hypothetical protein
LIKRDESRAFFFCTDSFAAVAASLALVQLCLNLERTHRRYRVNATVGVAQGSKGETLVFEDDLYGDSVNLACKLGEDAATPGQVRTLSWNMS